MYPILIEWHGVVIPTWHVCYLVAALVAFWVLFRLGSGGTNRDLVNVYIIAYVAGYFGARILSVVVEERFVGVGDFLAKVFMFGSLTLYGGVVLAVLSASLFVWWRRLPFWTLFDRFVVAFLIAVAIGRVGCFLNGDDYGVVVSENNPLGVVFPNLGDGLPRYPTQLFESAFCAIFFVASYFFFARLRARCFVGAMGLSGLGGYAVWRFFIEYLRGDYRGWVIWEFLSTSQFISIAVFLAVVCAFLVKMKEKINWLANTSQGEDTRS